MNSFRVLYEASLRKLLTLSSSQPPPQPPPPIQTNPFSNYLSSLLLKSKDSSHNSSHLTGHNVNYSSYLSQYASHPSFNLAHQSQKVPQSNRPPTQPTNSPTASIASGNDLNEASTMASKCDFCGYSFKCGGQIEKHKMLHASNNPKRPFKCHLCLVTFAKTEQLMRHMVNLNFIYNINSDRPLLILLLPI